MLVISGSATSEQLNEAWESIIEENGKHSGNNKFSLYQGLITDYGQLIATQTVVSVGLELLQGHVKYDWPLDYNVVQDCRERGYKIDTANKMTLLKSINAAKSKCKNLTTKAVMKRNEIERQFDGKKKESSSFDEVIGYLELALDRTILDAETMTLSKYNVLKKGAELRHPKPKNK